MQTPMKSTINSMTNNHKRYEELGWDDEIGNRIDQAVHTECKRIKIAKSFIPLYGSLLPEKTTISSDTVVSEEQVLTVNETATDNIVELQVKFTLTEAQVRGEDDLMTAVTLATRAANLLSQAEDVVIFQGQSAIDGNGGQQHPLFKEGKVTAKSGPAGPGLLNAPKAPIQCLEVPALSQPGLLQSYGENTFGAVAEAYSRLQSGEGLSQAHYGPYALVLNFRPYADTYAPLPTTLIMPADRIKPLVTEVIEKEVKERFYGTGTLPDATGILISLGGNTVDLAVGMDAKTDYLQKDREGRYVFRVYERFALRLKDPTSIIRLDFQKVEKRQTKPTG